MNDHEKDHISINGEEIPMERVLSTYEKKILVKEFEKRMEGQLYSEHEINTLLNWAVTTRAHMLALEEVIKGTLFISVNVGTVQFRSVKGGPGLLI